MCDAIMNLSDLVKPKPGSLGLIEKPSIAAGLLFSRHIDIDLICRSADLTRDEPHSRLLLATSDDVYVFPVLSSVLIILLDYKLVQKVRDDFKRSRLQGDILKLTSLGFHKVVQVWFPSSATDADRKIAFEQK